MARGRDDDVSVEGLSDFRSDLKRTVELQKTERLVQDERPKNRFEWHENPRFMFYYLLTKVEPVYLSGPFEGPRGANKR